MLVAKVTLHIFLETTVTFLESLVQGPHAARNLQSPFAGPILLEALLQNLFVNPCSPLAEGFGSTPGSLVIILLLLPAPPALGLPAFITTILGLGFAGLGLGPQVLVITLWRRAFTRC